MPPASDSSKPALYRVGKRIYRILQLSVTCILLLALLYGWRWLSDPVEFPIKAVKIHAAYEHIDQSTLRAQILPYLAQGFIGLNTNELKQQLLQLPWIAEVKIERIWPDTIIIQITEQQAVARWGKQGVLNAKGEIFMPPLATIPANLPLLNGPFNETTSIWQNYAAITQALQPLALTIHELDMDDRLSLQLGLNNGMRILLGKTDPLPRLQRFVKVYPKIFTSPAAQAEYIDLRYDNGLAVKWRDSNPSQSEKP